MFADFGVLFTYDEAWKATPRKDTGATIGTADGMGGRTVVLHPHDDMATCILIIL